MKTTFYLFLFLCLSSTLSCRKYKYKEGNKHLPRATERGRGIFACYIDDRTYIAKRQDAISYNQETGYLFIENSNNNFEFRLFVYEGIFEPGNYQFNNTNEEWITSDYSEAYGIKEGGINELIISELDIEKRFVSGTFNIDLADSLGQTIFIRDGRFDLKIQTIE